MIIFDNFVFVYWPLISLAILILKLFAYEVFEIDLIFFLNLFNINQENYLVTNVVLKIV